MRDRVVVVLDVLRATTTMVTALAHGASAIHVFDSLESAAAAAEADQTDHLLCGERKCLPPPGFDLGNSPGDYTAERVGGKKIFMSTTNGTRAIVAARNAPKRLASALVNASATAAQIIRLEMNVTLLCAGTEGKAAPEDLVGAGAIASVLRSNTRIESTLETLDTIQMFQSARDVLGAFLNQTTGGRNITDAGLKPDIDMAARLDAFPIAVEIIGVPAIAMRIMLA